MAECTGAFSFDHFLSLHDLARYTPGRVWMGSSIEGQTGQSKYGTDYREKVELARTEGIIDGVYAWICYWQSHNHNFSVFTQWLWYGSI